jgi:arginine/lysine/ornithine decarboxylase
LEEPPAAVYLTSPDYLGAMADIPALAAVVHRHGSVLAVDNAHGAYLKFLQPSLHPLDLGADLCCDSAHKTLPVLTGGAYLHISPNAPQLLAAQAKNALALHGSTSPSYLILQSLDRANAWLDQGHVKAFAARAEGLRRRLEQKGLLFYGQEPLKLTLKAASMGYTGEELGAWLRQQGIECEFADPSYVVLMLSATMTEEELDRLEEILAAIELREPVQQEQPAFHRCRQVMSVRQAMLSPAQTVKVEDSLGRVLAAPSVSCPPAVPIVICGEVIDAHAVKLLRYYGVEECSVVIQ